MSRGVVSAFIRDSGYSGRPCVLSAEYKFRDGVAVSDVFSIQCARMGGSISGDPMVTLTPLMNLRKRRKREWFVHASNVLYLRTFRTDMEALWRFYFCFFVSLEER